MLTYLSLVMLICGVKAEIPFTSCGGDKVKEVNISFCLEAPCMVRMGNTYQVFIAPEQIYPPVMETTVQVGIFQIGAYFEQTSVCLNPCVFSCFTSESSDYDDMESEPKFDLNVTISDRLIRIPGTLRVNTNYMDHLGQKTGFCIDISVNIMR